jgi:hypothetical protein
MSEFKEVPHRQVFIVMKKHDGGKLEFSDAYETEAAARQNAAKLITGGSPYICIHPVTLHGQTVVKVEQ